MVVGILEDVKLQSSQVWDVYAVIQPEESVRTRGPLGLGFVRKVFQGHQVRLQDRNDISLELLSVHD